MDPEDVGLIVDPHTVIENVHFTLEGEAFIKAFLNVYKLKIETVSQRLAILSYEKPVSKILSTGAVKVIKNDMSFLDRIKTWDDFDHPETGTREILLHELDDSETSHQRQITDKLDPGSMAYTLATVWTTHSVAICQDIIKSMDELVRKLAKSTFSYQKALHVASQLVKRIFTEIYRPRMGVSRFFRAGDMDQIMSAYLWMALRALNIGKEFRSIGFSNLDVVSSEITKFLLVNTGYDSIEKLEEKVATLEKRKKGQCICTEGSC